jgi:hypothetical protein
MRRVLPLRASNVVRRARKRRHDRSVGQPRRQPADVIEVQMRRDHDVDVAHRHPRGGECSFKAGPAIDRVDRRLLLAHLGADAGVDEHRVLGLCARAAAASRA